ncbi:MAG: patatin-like phospholipase family protein [Actinomycetales bacterium]|nr:patatin-like phospholipase family protein [Actinomycetales bacterium]
MTDDRLALAHLFPTPTAYVLGGGGSYGAVQMGMIRALAETDLQPRLIVGTSVGALNGVVLAADPGTAAARLAAIWPQIERRNVFPGNVVTSALAARSTRPWLFDPGPLSELLTTHLPVATIEQLRLPYVAIATDLDTGVRVDLDSGDLRSALLASAAVPGVFPWVDRDGRRLVDGGLVANVPVRQAVERGARSVVVLDCGLFGVDGRWAQSLVGVIVQALTIAARQQIVADLQVAQDVPVVYLPAPAAITTSIFDFAHTESLAERAYGDAVPMLARLAQRTEPLGPGLYGEPPVAIGNPAVAALRRM